MITAEDVVKVLDFGLARTFEGELSESEEAHSPTTGTMRAGRFSSMAVRFDGSLFTSPLMVLACLYLIFWDHHDATQYAVRM